MFGDISPASVIAFAGVFMIKFILNFLKINSINIIIE